MKTLLKRSEVKVEDTWKLEDLYEEEALWEEEYKEVEKLIDDCKKYTGKIGESAESLLGFFKLKDKMNMLFERVYVYANQRFHQDTSDGKYQAMSAKAQNLGNIMGAACSFFEPELLAMDSAKLQEMVNGNEELKRYKRAVDNVLWEKEHILDARLEEVLAKTDEIASCPSDVFSVFNNADIKFPSIKDEEGKKITVTHGNFIHFMESPDRGVRKEAFEAVYHTYGSFKNTLAALFQGNVKASVFEAKMRGFSSSLEKALFFNHIPAEVYDKLIDAVHENLDTMYRYVALRKKVLGVEELHMYDVYTPLLPAYDKKFTFEEAKETVKKGLAPLGEQYIALLEEGFSNRWIDVYENEGKRSGAYSWGAYGTHPYVLLNYQGNLDSVFTLAHEMGHALHSYHSDEAQDYVYAGYRIFVAEVASTCNESLLIHYMLEHAESKEEKAYLLNHFLDQFKGTLYRQTMFAEFEKITHEKVMTGEALTADVLCEIYFELNKKYFGPDMVSDEEIAMEWARIPHFYEPFYVYQYATGFSAAIAISRKILAGDKEVLEGYFKFLRGGSSLDPVDLLKLCGVDMTTPAPVGEALALFSELVAELEEII